MYLQIIMSPSGRILLRRNNQLITWDSLTTAELTTIKYYIDSKIERVRALYNDGGILLFNEDLFHHINRPFNIRDDLVGEIVSLSTAKEAYKEANLRQKIYNVHGSIEQRNLSVMPLPLQIPLPPNKQLPNPNPLYNKTDKTIGFELITPVDYNANLAPSIVKKALSLYLGKLAKGIDYSPSDMNDLIFKKFKGISEKAVDMLKGKVIKYHNPLSVSLGSHFYLYLV